MTDKLIIPSHIRDRALKAIAKIEAWNHTVATARSLAQLTGDAEEALNDVELTLRGHGWSLQKIYRDLGQERPAVEAWPKAQR